MATEVELERLVVRLIGDNSSYQKMLKDSVSESQSASRSVESAGKGIEGFSAQLQGFATAAIGAITAMGAALGVTSAFDAFKKSISLAATAEENEVAFGTMLQSAEKGKQMVEDLQSFAAATPLDSDTLQAASKTLLQFGVAGENVLPALKMIGDVTGGSAEKVKQMSLAFGQMSSTGRLMGQDLLQMINAGFNPLREISKTTGRSVMELKKDMEKGAISADMVAQAFQSATSEGGDFFGLMEKQSKTLNGLMSTMQDDINFFLREIGKELIEGLSLKEIIKGVSEVAKEFSNWYKSLSSESKEIILIIGVITTATTILIGTFIGLAGAFAIAGIVFNTMFGGIGIIIGAIVAAAAAVGVWVYSVGGLTEAWEILSRVASRVWDVMSFGAKFYGDLLAPIAATLSETFTTAYNQIMGTLGEINNALAPVWRDLQANAREAWKWLAPVLTEVVNFWNSIVAAAGRTFNLILGYGLEMYKGISQLFLDIGGFIGGVWESIMKYTQADWRVIARAIHDALVVGEHSINNFSSYIKMAWTDIKISFLSLTGEIVHFFQSTIPILLGWFLDVWKSAFTNAFEFAKTMMGNMVNAITDIANEIPNILQGKISLEEVLKRFDPKELSKGFKLTLAEFPEITKRELSNTEKELIDGNDKLKKEMASSLADLMKERGKAYDDAVINSGIPLPELVLPELDNTLKIGAFKLGGDLGKEINKGLGHEVKRLDAVLADSAEHMAILRESNAQGSRTRFDERNYEKWPEIMDPDTARTMNLVPRIPPIDLDSVPLDIIPNIPEIVLDPVTLPIIPGEILFPELFFRPQDYMKDLINQPNLFDPTPLNVPELDDLKTVEVDLVVPHDPLKDIPKFKEVEIVPIQIPGSIFSPGNLLGDLFKEMNLTNRFKEAENINQSSEMVPLLRVLDKDFQDFKNSIDGLSDTLPEKDLGLEDSEELYALNRVNQNLEDLKAINSESVAVAVDKGVPNDPIPMLERIAELTAQGNRHLDTLAKRPETNISVVNV